MIKKFPPSTRNLPQLLQNAVSEIRSTDAMSADGLRLTREWQGDTCRLSVTNDSPAGIRVSEVVAFGLPMPFPGDTAFYGEGYNMLSQYTGTLEQPGCITAHTDAGHYKLPAQKDFFTVYHLLLLFPQDGVVLMGFSSCHRFCGEIRFNPQLLEIVIDCEGLELPAGETWELEECVFLSGKNREALLATFASHIEARHARLPCPEIHTGWCSWYAYGPDVTEQDIFDNLADIKERVPQLNYIQIDDGYQKHMGDWLRQHPNFPSPIRDLCARIKEEGFEPAIWVAPFIADKDSDVLREHPEWFVKDVNGNPLPSDRVSFGGWRLGPWYMLDGTHPGAREYLRHVFHTMRVEWQCRYFKLDANLWGALPFGVRHDTNATRVEAYRAGMQALREGAGPDSFLLGCNAPMWPSIGTVHGMRVTDDFSRKWKTIHSLAVQGFHRGWQNGSLWINDPDCVVLANRLTSIPGADGKKTVTGIPVTENEFMFHAACILASGGMVLSGDRMMDLHPEQLQVLGKLLPPSGKAAVFDGRDFRVGRIPTETGMLLCLFNFSDAEEAFDASLCDRCDVSDFWTDEALFSAVATINGFILPPHSARVLNCVRAGIR